MSVIPRVQEDHVSHQFTLTLETPATNENPVTSDQAMQDICKLEELQSHLPAISEDKPDVIEVSSATLPSI
jgi:hypothetical protein